jgi:hypothetical protein
VVELGEVEVVDGLSVLSQIGAEVSTEEEATTAPELVSGVDGSADCGGTAVVCKVVAKVVNTVDEEGVSRLVEGAAAATEETGVSCASVDWPAMTTVPARSRACRSTIMAIPIKESWNKFQAVSLQ